MLRLINAARHSGRAFARLLRGERAFQQELLVLILALPSAWLIAPSWSRYLLLIGAILVLVLVEVLNTAVEAACDAVSHEFKAEIQLAKDCGSLAVLIAMLLVAGVWGLSLLEWWLGRPL